MTATPFLILAISTVFSMVSAIIGFFLKGLIDKQKDMQLDLEKLKNENQTLKSLIEQNGQRDKLIEQFYDKTVGIELKNIEKSISKLETKFDKYIDSLIKS